MLYLTNRTRFRHVYGTKISTMPNFIFASNTFMGLKINAFGVILDFIVFTYNLHNMLYLTILGSQAHLASRYFGAITGDMLYMTTFI